MQRYDHHNFIQFVLTESQQTMRFARPGLSESALAAHFEYLCSMSGAQRMAYVPVVASGYDYLF